MPPLASRLSHARRTTTSALLAALLAASVLVSVPVGAVPLTLQVFIVVLIALVVTPTLAALSVGTYLLVGAIGFPVFSGYRGGLGVLVGPTGGYLVGFLLAAVVGAWVRERLGLAGVGAVLRDVAAAVLVIVIVYTLGWVQLALATGMGLVPALSVGVAPFLIPDAIKAAAAVLLAPLVRRAAQAR